MKDGGVALVSYGFGCGENRLEHAIQDALDSPLLSNNDIYNAKRILLYLSYREDAHVKTEELNIFDNFIVRFDKHIEMSWGHGVDTSLQPDQQVKFTIIATGFGLDAVPEIKVRMDENTLLIAQQEDEIRRRQEARVKRIYGEDLNTNMKINRVSQSSIVILRLEEMDDDIFLNFIENTPTYNRSPKDIAAKRKPPKETPKTAAASAPSVANENTFVIDF
jgi:cell division protein FtsZ